MNNSKLVHYLNEGVKVKALDFERDYVGKEIDKIVGIHQWDKTGLLWSLILEGGSKPSFDRVTPYLYPLSCLTESIPYDGRMVVPLVELAKVEGTYKGEKYAIEMIDNFAELSWVDTDGTAFGFAFYLSDISFGIIYKYKSCHTDNVDNQLSLFQLLLKMQINIFPNEIDSIDPRTELVNPYL